MPIGDFLKQLGLTLGGIGAQGGQALAGAMQAQGSPLAYQEQQQNLRQRAAQDFASKQAGQLSAYEQAQLAQQKQFHDQQMQEFQLNQWREMASAKQAHDQYEEGNKRWLLQQLGEGTVEPASEGDAGAMGISGSFYRPAKRPIFKTSPEIQNLGFPSELPMTKENDPVIERVLGLMQAGAKKQISPELKARYMAQVDSLFPTTGEGVTIPEIAPGQPGKTQLAHLNNNPGNLQFANQPGAVLGEGGFAKFNSPAEGFKALQNQIQLDQSRGFTLGQYIQKYAPPDANNTALYIQQAAQALGQDPAMPLSLVDHNKLAQFQIMKESGSTLAGEQADPEKLKYNKLYKGQIQNLLDAGDLTRADTLLNTITDSRRKEDLAVQQKRAETAATDEQQRSEAQEMFPDSKLEGFWRQILKGRVSFNDAEKTWGLNDKWAKRRWADFVSAKLKDGDLPTPLAPNAQKELMTKEPVLDSLKLLKGELAKDAGDRTPGRYLGSRFQYAFGFSDKLGHTLSTGEMDKLRGAAQSLAGLRTALPIFQQAQIHTPNFWIDSGKEVNDKLDAMIDYLDNNIKEIYKFGAKSGVVQQPGPERDAQTNRTLSILQSIEEKMAKRKAGK